MTVDVDIVVIGAGFTGLAAGVALHEAGRTIRLFEARERVGGKVESQLDGLGRRVDTGGQYLADEMQALRALVIESGGRLVAHQHPGRTTTVPSEWHHGWDLGEALYESLRYATDVDSSTTFAYWVDGLQVSIGARTAIASTVNSQMCMDHRSLGLAHVADQLRRTPPLGAELQYSVDTTMHSVAEHLASRLEDAVELATPVRRVERNGGSVTVHTDRSATTTRHVVVAVPPSVVSSITFEPPLPAAVAEAAASFAPADVTKILLRYERPFWREKGFDGTIRFAEPKGLYVSDASVGAAHALVVFVGGPLATEWRTHGNGVRMRAAIGHVASVYGSEAFHPIDMLERDWPPDEWGGGGYCQFVPGSGAPTQVATLLGGSPGVTFAATELSDTFPGYIEGALHAGRRAAADAVARLDAHLAE